MFTGIIETVGEVVAVLGHDEIVEMTVRSSVSSELKVDQSVNHNGVCLTIVHVSNGMHRVQLVRETIARSNFKDVKAGDSINLERAMQASGRYEGHVVQGHVDVTGEVVNIVDGLYEISYDETNAPLLVEKGSVCINGVSLTIARLSDETFSVAIIPYTLDHTNFNQLKVGDLVNVEFDILGKYLVRMISLTS
jgi:riboflavin synthase